mmetsp:Transcript_7178/g.16672  ORF Transcript_7178/g.16672 Transcript_7178/m.16672 type:complete len:694 (-) Transcript_7178:123-2204(-)
MFEGLPHPKRMKNHYLKRRQTTATAASVANPQEYDDIEVAPLACNKSLDCELEADHCSVPSRRSSEAFLSELSPMSRRIVRFVTPTSSGVDRCTSECMTVALARILPSLAVIFGFPFVLWDGHPEEWSALNLYPLFRHVEMVWSSMLHTSLYTVAVATFVTVACIPNGGLRPRKMLPPRNGSTTDRLNVALSGAAVNITQSSWKSSLALAVVLTTFGLFHMTLQMGYPHIMWNPFMWGWYTVYLPGSIPKALRGACLDMQKHSTANQPLCLSEDQWQELSSGQLSSYNPDDVYSVQRGLDYLQNQSGGVVINALARDVADAIPLLKQNMEGLAPFFQDSSRNKLSLVVFENDSNDGTRALFKSWASEESRKESPRYVVDIMGCGDANPDCILGIQDRYDKDLFKDPNASGVGKLGEFRNVLLEYILSKDEYKNFSHMVVLDVDLGVSISPLGLIHTLGLENGLGQDYAVASSSSQVWPGTMGSIIPPYDLSAFRPKESSGNEKLRGMHQWFCHLMPAGDRWRNLCEAASPMQLFMIQSANDPSNNHNEPYEVGSAFNGVTIYPMRVVRERGEQARYDSGDDNQQCEHVGFHLSLDRRMYVNPKWSMNLRPNKPGGPTGIRAVKTLFEAVIGRPNVVVVFLIGNNTFFFVAVFALWMIGLSLKRLMMVLYDQEKESRRRPWSADSTSGINTREM